MASMTDNLCEQSHGLRLAFLGENKSTLHFANLRRLLAPVGIDLTLIEDSISFGVFDAAESMDRIGRILSAARRVEMQLIGTTDRRYLQYLARRIDDQRINCVIAYWGSRPLADILAIRRLRPDVKIILNLLCHPLGLTKTKVAIQNWLLRTSGAACDAVIVSSQVMQTYLQTKVFTKRQMRFLLWPPYLSRWYHPKKRLPVCGKIPNLLFMGRMDWQTAQPSDNLTRTIEEFLEQGICVYHHTTRTSIPSHPRRHTFDYMSFEDMAVFSTQFDASLVAYNLDACTCRDRFNNTIPDRLLSSVSAGIPIAIPTHDYRACREFLEPYQAVIEFDSPSDLYRKLNDRAEMEVIHAAALRNRGRFIGEDHIWTLVNFARTLIA